MRRGEHLWTATAMWLVSDPAKQGEKILDRDNLLVPPVIGCYICEEPYSKRLMQRRCSGRSRPGPTSLIGD